MENQKWKTLTLEYLTQNNNNYKMVAQVRSNDKLMLFELRAFVDGIPTKTGISLKAKEMKWLFERLTDNRDGILIAKRQLFVEPLHGGAIITLVGYDWLRMLYLSKDEIQQFVLNYHKMSPFLM